MINPERCSGCRTCEIVCSLIQDGECNPAASRIAIIRYEDLGIYLPMTCQHCESAVCMDICPAGAIYRDESIGAILIDVNKCIGCKLCLMACPIGGVQLHPVSKRVVKCDLCGGEPKCVEFCPGEALEFLSPTEVSIRRKTRRIKDLGMYLAMLTGQQPAERTPQKLDLAKKVGAKRRPTE